MINREIVRHSYETSIERAARVAGFVMSNELYRCDDEIQEHYRRLLIDDLIVLSISLRRLIESTNLVCMAQNSSVSLATFTSEAHWFTASRALPISLWRILGLVVHSKAINVIDCELDLASYQGSKTLLHFVAERHDRGGKIGPLCGVKSDRSAALFFLDEFFWRTQAILEASRRASRTHGLHLDLDWD